MNRYALALVVLSLGACATNEKDDRITTAIEDFVVVSDLEGVKMIRSYQRFESRALNDRYVIVYTKKDYYLLFYSQRCRVNYDMPRRPDLREDPYAIYADSGTFRGCRIEALYSITGAQALELAQLGRAPGEG